MAEFRDKEWDRRYESFKLLKERRRQLELDKSSRIMTGSQQDGILNKARLGGHRSEIDSQKEKRTFTNKGQSRFLREHSINLQEKNMNQSQPNISQLTHQNDEKQNSFESGVIEEARLSITDILPYIFIVIGILIIILILVKAV